jgi:hypothetical protein
MALKKFFHAVVQVAGDGVATTFTLNLANDPYFIPNNVITVPSEMVNWFVNKTSTPPTALYLSQTYSVNGRPFTATLANQVVTITYATPIPDNNLDVVYIGLLF